MRRMLNVLAAIALPMLATAATVTTADAQSACAQVRAACQNAGFVQGAARDGIGLQVHCIVPILQGAAQPASARRPLPSIDPQLAADCRGGRGRFTAPSETAGQPVPVPAPPSGLTALPGQDAVLRPPTPMMFDRRAALSALPPEDQPETGPAKSLPPHLRRTAVDYRSNEPAGTIIVDTPNTYLYLILGNGKAMRYGIGVGREGSTWSGGEKITKMAEWPDWHPPEEMIERQPYLPRFMAGGEGNPLGARALYLGQTLYRIHGTNQPSTIGTFVSSGCIRLTNEDISDLYGRVKVGTRVVVLPGKGPNAVQAMPSSRATETRAKPKDSKEKEPKAAAAQKPAAPSAQAPAPASAAPAEAAAAPAVAAPAAKTENAPKESTGTVSARSIPAGAPHIEEE
ncbi:MAG: L,D-transpeptidase [Hyphomicrobiales bacterium]|nr:L,D-transpeptidase [Hyphomicrobiales bacterium]